MVEVAPGVFRGKLIYTPGDLGINIKPFNLPGPDSAYWAAHDPRQRKIGGAHMKKMRKAGIQRLTAESVNRPIVFMQTPEIFVEAPGYYRRLSEGNHRLHYADEQSGPSEWTVEIRTEACIPHLGPWSEQFRLLAGLGQKAYTSGERLKLTPGFHRWLEVARAEGVPEDTFSQSSVAHAISWSGVLDTRILLDRYASEKWTTSISAKHREEVLLTCPPEKIRSTLLALREWSDALLRPDILRDFKGVESLVHRPNVLACWLALWEGHPRVDARAAFLQRLHTYRELLNLSALPEKGDLVAVYKILQEAGNHAASSRKLRWV